MKARLRTICGMNIKQPKPHKPVSWHIKLLCACALSMALPVTAHATRCGTHIITRGDTQAKVLRYCGEPIQTNSRYATRGSRHNAYRVPARNHRRHSAEIGNEVEFYFSEEVLIEEWIFNFGPNRLMREITFENGEVVKVETLEYGFTY